MPVRSTLAALGLAAALVATPALAEGGDGYYEDTAEAPPLPPMPEGPMAQARTAPVVGYTVEQRDTWLAECRDRMGADNGVGGAVIGGVIGGVAGNRIAGRGNRVAGTVIGAGVGAVAGAAIDRAEDRGAARDFCEDYLSRYEASYAAGPGVAYAGYGGPVGPYSETVPQAAYGQVPYVAGRVMWVPVTIASGCRPKCDCQRERVVEEWIDEPVPARRVIRDKRIKLQPAKPTKYTKTKYSK